MHQNRHHVIRARNLHWRADVKAIQVAMRAAGNQHPLLQHILDGSEGGVFERIGLAVRH